MAFDEVAKGAPMAGLGLVAAAIGIFLYSSLDVTAEVLRRIDAHPRLLLVQLGLLWTMIAAFEILRLGSSGVERSRGPRAPRVLATAFIPSMALLACSLSAAPLWPRLTQALFVTGVIGSLGAWPATAFCVVDMLLPPSSARRRTERWFITGSAGAAAFIGLWLIAWPHPVWAARATWVGWDLVSAVLR